MADSNDQRQIDYLRNHLGREDRRHALLWALLLTLLSGLLVLLAREPRLSIFWTLPNGIGLVLSLVLLSVLWIDPAANHIFGKFMPRGVPDDVRPEGMAHWLALVDELPFAPNVIWLAFIRSTAYLVAIWVLLRFHLALAFKHLEILAIALFLFLAASELFPLIGRRARRFLVRIASGTYLGLLRQSQPGARFYQAHRTAIQEIQRKYPRSDSQLQEATDTGVRISSGFLFKHAWMTRPIGMLVVTLAGLPFLLAFKTASQSLWHEDPGLALGLVEMVIGLVLAIRLLSNLILDNSRALLDQLYHEVVAGGIVASRIPWYVQVITAHQQRPLLHIHSLHQIGNESDDG